MSIVIRPEISVTSLYWEIIVVCVVSIASVIVSMWTDMCLILIVI